MKLLLIALATTLPYNTPNEISHTVRIPLHFSTADGTIHYSQSWIDTIQIKQFTQLQFFYENLSNTSGTPVTWERINSSITLKRLGATKNLAKTSYVKDIYQITSNTGDGTIDWDGNGGHTSPIISRFRWGPNTHRTDQDILNYFSQNNVFLDMYGNSKFNFFSTNTFWAMGMRHHSGGEILITYHY